MKYFFSLFLFGLSTLGFTQQLVWTELAQQDSNQVNAVAFSIDGNMVASGTNCHNATAKLYNTSNGTVTWTHVVPPSLQCLMGIGFSSDGQYMGIMEEAGNILIYDYTKNPPDSINTIDMGTNYAFSIAFAPNSKKVAVGGSNGKLKSYLVSSGSADLDVNAHTSYVTTVNYSPDNKWIVTGSNLKKVRVWDTLGVKQYDCIGHTSWVTCAKFSTDNSKIFSSARDKTIRIWDAVDGSIIDTIVTSANWVNQIDVSPDGQYIAAALSDGYIEVFSTATYASVMRFRQDHNTYPICVAWSPDSKKLVTGTGSGLVTLYDVSTVGLEENIQPIPMVAFPNPFENHIKIRTIDDVNSFQVLDQLGRVVSKGVCETVNGFVHLEVPGLTPGVYFVNLKAAAGKSYTIRTLKR